MRAEEDRVSAGFDDKKGKVQFCPLGTEFLKVHFPGICRKTGLGQRQARWVPLPSKPHGNGYEGDWLCSWGGSEF